MALPMVPFEWKRPNHTRWLAACVIGLVLATLAGGFDLSLTALFVIIFGVGAVVLSLDGLGAPGPEPTQSEPTSDVMPSDDQPPA